MPKNTDLIIVESPTKAKTLARFLGDKFTITASGGHVRDLPKSKLGIEIENNFSPQYIISPDKKDIVTRLKKEAKAAGEVYIATDPDREGEAIAWHIQAVLEGKDPKRISFHEITEEAVSGALKNPRQIDLNLVDAQQARRVLDRLVGYKLSPLLWRKVRVGLSAGRVQSVALRLIVEREREVDVFKPVEYWTIEAKLDSGKVEFIATLIKKSDKKLQIQNSSEASEVVKDLKTGEYKVADTKDSQSKRSPYPPFTTSTLQQASSNKLGFTGKKTMLLAQQLYEGVEIGKEGSVGLITYMRTDSLNVAESAIASSREFIKEKYGPEFVPSSPRRYKTKSKGAQEAHEAIRPTATTRTPESLKNSLNRDQMRLYELIWNRFVASQMVEAVYKKRSIDISSGPYLLRASGSEISFLGWMRLYDVTPEDESKEEDSGHLNLKLPELKVGEGVTLVDLASSQHFTEPPPRYSEASLVKALEEHGIGRPSTYVPIISTLIERLYIEREERKLLPTPLGVAVNDFLVQNFSDIIEVGFTAKMERLLDDVALGKEKWQPIIANFYGPFEEHLVEVQETASRVKIIPQVSTQVCPDCGKQLLIRIGRFGKFLACSGYPECKHTEKFVEKVDAKCPEDGGDVVLLRTRRGRPFYGCSNYPKCKYMSWHKPTGLQSEAETRRDKPTDESRDKPTDESRDKPTKDGEEKPQSGLQPEGNEVTKESV